MALNAFSLDASADGLKLACLQSVPDAGSSAPRGVIQLVHGMCEHKERYIALMEFLSENGLICVIHDNRGHGASVNVTAQVYPQMRHEIHNETGYRRVWDDLLHFIDNTLNPS